MFERGIDHSTVREFELANNVSINISTSPKVDLNSQDWSTYQSSMTPIDLRTRLSTWVT
jgi:hypothetical protein